MGVLDHWHPVLSLKSLRRGPQGIRLAGREIAVFDAGGGRIGAVDDCCVHRRARLSLGRVVGKRLQCPYHGWTVDADGECESPGTPRLHACTVSYETCARYGYVWIRAQGGQRRMPVIDAEGNVVISVESHAVDAPLELVLDNFTEMEHTPTTHANLGYALSGIDQVTADIEAGDDWVRVINRGPQKWTPWAYATLGGFWPTDTFVNDWTTYFSPVHTVYDQYWTHPKTGVERRDRYRFYVFFNPIDEARTQLVVFGFQIPESRLHAAALRLARPLIARTMRNEIVCDVKMIEGLADKRTDLEGMKLSRFDRVLGMHRERIARIYRGDCRQRAAA